MNRKDFLALIPALSSVPFIGKELIRQDNKIILLEPKPIEVVKEMPDFKRERYNSHNFGLQLTYNGHVVAVADMTGYCNRHSWQVEREHMPAFGHCESLDRGYEMYREPEIRITASFRDGEIMKAVHAIQDTYEGTV